jgi:hypothetical protein
VHAVAAVDVVLDHDRNAVHRAAHAAGLALGVELVGDRERVGVQFDDRVHALVDRRDPGQVPLGERACGEPSVAHRLLHGADRHLLEVDGRGLRAGDERHGERGGGGEAGDLQEIAAGEIVRHAP